MNYVGSRQHLSHISRIATCATLSEYPQFIFDGSQYRSQGDASCIYCFEWHWEVSLNSCSSYFIDCNKFMRMLFSIKFWNLYTFKKCQEVSDDVLVEVIKRLNF